uniref:Uncharacterized LOC111196673 n=1 Tax=Astyanax mexicanus TaxID=7994 RepID=W5L3L1_ASTMX
MQVGFYLLLLLHFGEGCILQDQGKTIMVTADISSSVLLSCYCSDLQTTPEAFIWRKHKTNWEDIDFESDQYRNRVQLFDNLSPANLSLLISHLTEEDAGDYECNAKGRQNIYFRLTIKGSGSIERPLLGNPIVILFAAVGVLALVMVLGGIICCRYRARRRGQMKTCERKERRNQESKDDVTYSTIVHIKSLTPTSPVMNTRYEYSSEYACIKLN